MQVAIKQNDTGQIYSNDMGADNKHSILAMHFCTSYTQVVVQDEVDGKFPTHDIILPAFGTEPNGLSYAIDHMATQNDPEGEWISCQN